MDYKFDFNKFIHSKRMKQKDAELLKNSQKVNTESAEFKEGVKEALREILNLDANL